MPPEPAVAAGLGGSLRNRREPRRRGCWSGGEAVEAGRLRVAAAAPTVAAGDAP